jgi:hypothetical protein
MLGSLAVEASNPYVKVGKQYNLTRYKADISFEHLPRTDIILLNLLNNFLKQSVTSTVPELHSRLLNISLYVRKEYDHHSTEYYITQG